VIVIRHLFEAEEMFNMQQRGRVFAIFRHPVDRSVSMYNYITFADWEPTYNAEIASMTLEEYVKSPFMEQDWLTRYLSNTMTGPLSEENFESAKEALRRKVMVGLLEKKEATLERFEKFFGCKYKARPKVQQECCVEYLGVGVNENIVLTLHAGEFTKFTDSTVSLESKILRLHLKLIFSITTGIVLDPFFFLLTFPFSPLPIVASSTLTCLSLLLLDASRAQRSEGITIVLLCLGALRVV